MAVNFQNLTVTSELTPELLFYEQPQSESKILLTVAIPAYRHERYISSLLLELRSVKQKSEMEIIIIDDCSPDGTVQEAIKCLAGSELKFRIYRNSVNRGLSYGLNFLLSEAKGDCFLPCASDDVIFHENLDQILSEFSIERVPSSFTIFGAEYIGIGKGPVYNTSHIARITKNADTFVSALSKSFPRPLLLQSTVFNTHFLQGVRPWRHNLLLDDWPTFILAGQAAAAQFLPIEFRNDVVLTGYRLHDGGVHNNIARQREACLQVVDEVLAPKFKAYARATVLSDIAAIQMYERQYYKGFRDYLCGIAAYPSPAIIARLPLRAIKAIVKRWATAMRKRKE